MRRGAGPAPILRPAHEPSPNGVERDISQRRRQMRFVHRHGAEAALPKLAGLLLPRVNMAGVPPMRLRQRPSQTVRVGGVQDQMDVIGRQNPGPDLHTRLAAMRAQKLFVESVVLVPKKRPRAAIAPLCDMMGKARSHGARETSHANKISRP